MGQPVFVSYSEADKKAADRICEILEQGGVDCWIAPRNIPAGATWANATVRGIERSKAMVLVCSESANQSRQMARELQLADDHKLPIIPVRLSPAELSGDLRYFLDNTQWLNAFPGTVDDHAGPIVWAVKAALLPPGERTAATAVGWRARAAAAAAVKPAQSSALPPAPEPAANAAPPVRGWKKIALLAAAIRRLLSGSLSGRYRTMAEVTAALKGMDTNAPAQQTTPAARLSVSGRRMAIRKAVLTAMAIASAVTITIIGMRTLQRSPEGSSPRTVRFTITPANLVRSKVSNEIDAEVSISRDGKHIGYVESQGGQLWIRDLDQEQARPVVGATNVYQVFWSPDNAWIGYSAGAACEQRGGCDLLKIPVQGGTPVLVAKLQGQFRRACWSSTGESILFCDATGMYTVPARGGPVTRIIEHPHIEHPSFLELPGKRHAYLYQAFDKEHPDHAIYVQLPGENRRLVATSSSVNPYPYYSPTGHIIYVDGKRDETAIWALPFSLESLQATGKAFPIAQHGASPAVSQTGTLVYSDVASDRQQLVIVNRAGESLRTIGELQRQNGPTLSPDGRKLVVNVMERDNDLWVYDLERGGRIRLTSDPALERLGTWAPRGDQITYTAVHDGVFEIDSKPSSGNGEAEGLMKTTYPVLNPAWSPDGRFLLYTAISPQTKADLMWRARRENGSLGDPVVFLKTRYKEAAAQFSPDGQFVAYVSDESGSDEVYVRDFPAAASKWQVSLNGGIAPRWRRDGKELFYLTQNGLMAVSVTNRLGFSAGAPTRLFEKRSTRTGSYSRESLGPQYDVSADGKSFVILDRPGGEQPLSIHVVHNWFDEFRGRTRK